MNNAPQSQGKNRRYSRPGVDTFRLNFSHGTHEDHAKVHAAIRALELKVARPIGILQDLQGPKIRVGTIKDGKIAVVAGEQVRFVLSGSDGDKTSIPLPHPEIYDAATPGDDLLIDDGRVRVRVTGLGTDFIDAKIITGGFISNRKGVNVPTAVLNLSPLTTKDRALAFGLELGVDWLPCRLYRNRATLSKPARWSRIAPVSWRRLKSRPLSNISMTSSVFPMRSWSLAATLAWRFRTKRCPAVRRSSSNPAAWLASR